MTRRRRCIVGFKQLPVSINCRVNKFKREVIFYQITCPYTPYSPYGTQISSKFIGCSHNGPLRVLPPISIVYSYSLFMYEREPSGMAHLSSSYHSTKNIINKNKRLTKTKVIV